MTIFRPFGSSMPRLQPATQPQQLTKISLQFSLFLKEAEVIAALDRLCTELSTTSLFLNFME